MIEMLMTAWGARKWIGYIAAALVAAAAVWYVMDLRETVADQKAEITQLTVDRDKAVTAAQANAKALEDERKHHEETRKARAEYQREAEEGRARVDEMEKEANRAPASDDGPIAPVLRRAFDRLYDQAGAVSGGRVQDGQATGPR